MSGPEGFREMLANLLERDPQRRQHQARDLRRSLGSMLAEQGGGGVEIFKGARPQATLFRIRQIGDKRRIFMVSFGGRGVPWRTGQSAPPQGRCAPHTTLPGDSFGAGFRSKLPNLDPRA